MTQEQVLEYLNLVNRRLYILTHSGVEWKPEYSVEMDKINQRLKELRPFVDAALGR